MYHVTTPADLTFLETFTSRFEARRRAAEMATMQGALFLVTLNHTNRVIDWATPAPKTLSTKAS